MSPPSMQPRRRRRLGLALFLILMIAVHSPVMAQGRSAPPADDASLFREGEILLSRGDVERALWRFKRLITEYPKSPLLDEARFRMGICYTQLKRPGDGIRVLNELLSTFLAPARMIQVFTLLGDNHLELKDPFNALLWYGKGLLVEGQSKEELKNKVKSILDAFDSEETLTRVETLYRGAYAGGYAKFRLAQIAKRRGDSPLLKKIVTEMEKEYPGMDFLPQARDLLGPSVPPEKSKYTVGVVLPLSGVHQVFGTRVLQAIQLAVRETPAQEKTPLLSLAVRDSKGNPREVERAVEDLATKERPVAILGPLLSGTIDQAGRKAQQWKIPLLSLSQKEAASGKGDYVFQNALTPADQAQALASFAVKEMERRTFAVFYPNSPYGLSYKNLFSQEVSRRGGKVVGSVAYHEEQTDFSQEIKGFFKIRATQDYDSRKRKAEEFKPGLTVDAIFIPDTYDRVGLILSQMAYFDITGSIFLGTNAWNHPRLVSIAGAAAEGAFFVDCFSSTGSDGKSFVEEFRKAYQREPETLEAIAYDGARFLREVLLAKPTTLSAGQLKEGILKTGNFQGVSGLKGFGENGKAIRNLIVLTVKDGQITQLTP